MFICNKVKYPNVSTAIAMAIRINAKGRSLQAAYRCPACGPRIWHLTSQRARGAAVPIRPDALRAVEAATPKQPAASSPEPPR